MTYLQSADLSTVDNISINLYELLRKLDFNIINNTENDKLITFSISESIYNIYKANLFENVMFLNYKVSIDNSLDNSTIQMQYNS